MKERLKKGGAPQLSVSTTGTAGPLDNRPLRNGSAPGRQPLNETMREASMAKHQPPFSGFWPAALTAYDDDGEVCRHASGHDSLTQPVRPRRQAARTQAELGPANLGVQILKEAACVQRRTARHHARAVGD